MNICHEEIAFLIFKKIFRAVFVARQICVQQTIAINFEVNSSPNQKFVHVAINRIKTILIYIYVFSEKNIFVF